MEIAGDDRKQVAVEGPGWKEDELQRVIRHENADRDGSSHHVRRWRALLATTVLVIRY
jgi:hypothetical protein